MVIDNVLNDSDSFAVARVVSGRDLRCGLRSSAIEEGSCTLVEVLRERASRQPDHPLYTFLLDGEAESAVLTCAGLDRRARVSAQRRGRGSGALGA